MRVSGLLFCKHVLLRQQEWSLLRMHIFSVKAEVIWNLYRNRHRRVRDIRRTEKDRADL